MYFEIYQEKCGFGLPAIQYDSIVNNKNTKPERAQRNTGIHPVTVLDGKRFYLRYYGKNSWFEQAV